MMQGLVGFLCVVTIFSSSFAGESDILLDHKDILSANNEIHSEGEGFRPATMDDLTDDLRTWEAPDYIKKSFPYYMSGLDYEGRPTWVAEVGKYDLRTLIQRGPEAEAALEKTILQAAKAILDTHHLKYEDNHDASFIIDMEGLRYEQFADVPSITFLLRVGRKYRKLLEEGTGYVAVLNANYVTQTAIAIMRPVIGKTWEVVEVFGNDKAKWIPQLLRQFPRESLPEWYGGYKNFTPFKIMP